MTTVYASITLNLNNANLFGDTIECLSPFVPTGGPERIENTANITTKLDPITTKKPLHFGSWLWFRGACSNLRSSHYSHYREAAKKATKMIGRILCRNRAAVVNKRTYTATYQCTLCKGAKVSTESSPMIVPDQLGVNPCEK